MTTTARLTSDPGPRTPIDSADEIRARLAHSVGRADTATTPHDLPHHQPQERNAS